MAEARVPVGKDTDGESTEGVGDLDVLAEADGGPEIDLVAAEGYDEHGGHLFEFGLVDDCQADGEDGDPNELGVDDFWVVWAGCIPVGRHRTRDLTGGVGVR